MSITDSKDRYGTVSVALHWVTFLLIAALVVVGWVFSGLPTGPERASFAGLHMSLGMLFAMVLVLRLAWRLVNGAPEPLPTHKPLEQLAAKLVHRLLIALLVIIPVAGMVTVGSAGRVPHVFGMAVPLPFVPQSEGLHEVAEVVHGFSANFLLLPLLALHVLGALKHHLVDRDATLRRITGRDGEEEPVGAA